MKHLIIFDIDGTVTDSVTADYRCFEASLHKVFGFDTREIDWHSFPNMTDAALVNDVVIQELQRAPTEAEVTRFKEVFFDCISNCISDMPAVSGVVSFILQLQQREDCRVAFATGCWKKSAALKLDGVGIQIDQFVAGTSDDHHLRSEIIHHAIRRSKSLDQTRAYLKTTYIGDGVWDIRSSAKLGIDFLGVDIHGSHALQREGAKHVIQNFRSPHELNKILFT